jgi:hypothetical protein
VRSVEGRRSLAWLAVALLTALAMLNAGRYLEWVANPVIHSDGWYFLDAFVEPWVRGELDWRHFFEKRDASDHAQPLHRLVLWWQLEFGDLDFTMEARLGLLGLCLGLVLMQLLCWRHLRHHGEGVGALLALAPIALLPWFVLSLNSHETYYWSLVMFFHLSLLPALLLMALVSETVAKNDCAQPSRLRLGLVFVLALLLQPALDGAALLVVLAMLLTLLWAGWRWRRGRAALQLGACMVAAMLLFRLTYAWLMPPVGEGSAGGLLQAASYLVLHAGEAWKWLLLPAGASVVHPDHLPFWFEADDAPRMQWALALLVLVLHVAFWWSQLRDRRPSPLSLFAMGLMLLTYGLVAGILRSRVPVFGSDYLLQMRYVTFYQLANLALLLQCVVVIARSDWRLRRPLLAGLAVLLLAGGALQWALAQRAWEHGQYIRAFGLNMAGNVHCLGQHPRLEAPVCQPGNAVCALPPVRRQQLLDLLRARQLNVFAPAFVERHGLAESLSSTSCLAESP